MQEPSKKRTKMELLRLEVFKNSLQKNDLINIYNLDSDTLEKLLDLAVIPNSLNTTAVKYSIYFNYLFIQKKPRKENFVNFINNIINHINDLSITEKNIIKYGLLHRFETNSWKAELYKYLKSPLGLHGNASGRKILSGTKFKETFFFAKNLCDRALKNKKFPKI